MPPRVQDRCLHGTLRLAEKSEACHLKTDLMSYPSVCLSSESYIVVAHQLLSFDQIIRPHHQTAWQNAYAAFQYAYVYVQFKHVYT